MPRRPGVRSSGRSRIDRDKLLRGLPVIEPPEEEAADAGEFEQASLAGALLMLVGVDQESEYVLCRKVAEHLLGEIPEPDDLEL